MEDTGGSDVVLESLLHSVDLAREEGLERISLKAGEIAEQTSWDESVSVPTICRILESRWFEEQAGVTLVHRIGIRGGPETVYLFDVVGSRPNRGPMSRWRKLMWWWMQVSPLERAALVLAGSALILALLAVWQVSSTRSGIGWSAIWSALLALVEISA